MKKQNRAMSPHASVILEAPKILIVVAMKVLDYVTVTLDTLE